MKKKNSKISLKKTNHNSLSIQFSLGGFSFCVSDTTSKEIIHFTSYDFEENLNSPEDLLDKIKLIFSEDAFLHLEFDQVVVIHQNNLQTIVPLAFFEEEKLSKYLNLNIKILQNDFITYDSIVEIDVKNVYIPYVNINNYLFQNFGEFEYRHHSTLLIEKLLKKNKIIEKAMFVNVSKTTIDVVVLAHKKLLLYNHFSYKTKEDFIYYILFVAEQLQLDNEQFKLFFTGDINIESQVYKITYDYIKNVQFLESENPIFKEIDVKNHSNFLLLA